MFLDIADIHKIFLDHPNVVTDSRKIIPSCFFFALRGEQFNGNRFAAEAIEKGAAYAVVDAPEYANIPGCILVSDVLASLQELAAYHRSRFNIPVLAITGSNGKTTTKELISAVLSSAYNIISTQGNLNNHIGVPLTLLRLTPETEIAVIEMGANHPGEIDFLCRIANPGFGLITNIGRAHLEGFGGFAGVVRTKTELYRFLEETGGKVFVNSADPLLMQHSSMLERTTYGFVPEAGFMGEYSHQEDLVSISFPSANLSPVEVRSRLFGGYNAINILAAACIGRYFGVGDENIRTALEKYTPSNNRSEVRKTARNVLILDAYNANPSSMEAALRHFAASSFSQKTVILGDMLELGDESDNLHTYILKLLEELGFTDVYLVGPVFTAVNRKREFHCFGDNTLAKLWFEHHPLEGRTVLIKGSRGIRLETISEIL